MNRKLFISIVALIWTGLSFAQHTISIRTNSTASGDTGTFTIVMQNDIAVNGLNFVLRYDSKLITPLRISPTGNASLLGGSSAALFGDDRISFLVYDVGSSMASPDSGTIFQVEYIVKDSIHDTTSTPLTFTEGAVADSAIHLVTFEYVPGIVPISPVLSVHEAPGILPQSYRLDQNYPNPFNPITDVRYAMCDVSHVSLKVYDVLGREITTLVNEVKQPGEYTIRWDASNLPSGVYFYRLTTDRFSSTKKLVLMK